MSWVLTNWAAGFDAVGNAILLGLLNIERFFLWLPWTVGVVLIGITARRVMRLW